jgi:ATP-dependent DNA ligase
VPLTIVIGRKMTAQSIERNTFQHLEGIVGKRRDSIYEPGKRSAAWNYREPIQL